MQVELKLEGDSVVDSLRAPCNQLISFVFDYVIILLVSMVLIMCSC